MLLWQMLSRPQPSFTRTICAEMVSLSSFLKRSVQKVSMTWAHRHVCLYLWVGSLLLEMVEDRRDVGRTCSGPARLTGAPQRDADRDGNTEQHVFDFTLEQKNCLYCFIWCLTVLYKWMLLSETVPEVGVWCQYRSLSPAQEAPAFLWTNPETPLLVFFSQRRPQRCSWALRGEKSNRY